MVAPLGSAVDTLLLFSGGLDSLVLAHQLVRDGRQVHLLRFDFGGPAANRELVCAERAAGHLALPLDTVDLESMTRLQEQLGGQQVPRDISGFHLLLSVACLYAQLRRIPEVAAGITREQVENHPSRKEFLKRWSELLSLENPDAAPLSVIAPFIALEKADILRNGVTLGTDLFASWSCSARGDIHCGTCRACLRRQGAFRRAAIDDLTGYATGRQN